jgi:hypothetical protein
MVAGDWIWGRLVISNRKASTESPRPRHRKPEAGPPVRRHQTGDSHPLRRFSQSGHRQSRPIQWLERLSGISAIAATQTANTDSPITKAKDVASSYIVKASPHSKDFGSPSLSSFAQFCRNRRTAAALLRSSRGRGLSPAQTTPKRILPPIPSPP